MHVPHQRLGEVPKVYIWIPHTLQEMSGTGEMFGSNPYRQRQQKTTLYQMNGVPFIDSSQLQFIFLISLQY